MTLFPAQARLSPARSGPSPTAAAMETVQRLRRVHRAASELRRGVPVLLTGEAPLVLIAAETAGPDGLADLGAWAAEVPVLLLAPTRAAAVLRRPVEQVAAAVALRLPNAARDPEMLRGLATQDRKSVVLVTHDPNAWRYGDRMIRLVDGKIDQIVKNEEAR